MQLLTQRNFRDRLYHQLPPEWFPDLDDAPNIAAVLDMLATSWSSQGVVQRQVQFNVSSNVIALSGSFAVPVGSSFIGDGVLGNPVVTKNSTQVINGVTYQIVTVSQVQNISAGTNLIFNMPDAQQNGISQFLSYMQNQSRLQTSTDMWLDFFAQDFFGPKLQRHVDETDVSFRTRILANVLAPRVTRCAVACGLTNLTGFKPTIIEPRDTGDCGGYGSTTNRSWTGLAYNNAGYYGSMELPFQFFIKAIRPPGQGIPDVNGYGMSNGGYATYPLPWGYINSFPSDYGLSEYVDLADLDNNLAVTDDDIYTMIADSVAAGVTAWTNISSDIQSELRSTGLLDVSFYLDQTMLADQAANPGQMFASGTINLACIANVSMNTIAAAPFITLAAVGAVNNPMPMIGTGTISLAAQIAFNMVFAEVTASLGLAAASTITSDNNASSISSISIGSVIEAASNNISRLNGLLGSTFYIGYSELGLSTANLRTPMMTIQIEASGVLLQQPQVIIGPISAFAYVVNGTLAIDYITIDFTLGTSMLTPPGSYLGQTFLLGSSEIGVNTGF